ncbi:MAG: HU family DNA-binding protein [bacterium]
MTKADLVAKVSETGITKKQAAAAVEATIAAVKEALAKGESVRLVDFGTFSVKTRKARTGRNPRTGKALKIPAKKVPTFSPGKGLKEAVS